MSLPKNNWRFRQT